MAYYIQDSCVACGKCVVECPAGAIVLTEDRPEIDPDRCVSCGACRALCNQEAPVDLDAPPEAAAPHPPREKECDLIVLGGGGSGLVAAARAAWLTGRRVIVAEKNGKTGGGAWYAADFKVFNSRWQKERGILDVLEESLRKAMDDTYWRLNPRLARNCFEATGQFFDWLCDTGHGVEEQFQVGTYIFDGPDGPKVPVFKKMRRGRQGGAGKFVMDQMLDLCGALGVEVLTRHRAVGMTAEDGRVTSVLLEDEGGETRVSCKACVLATGSWIQDQTLLRRVDPLFAQMKPVRSPHRNPAYTGDGIRLAEQAGVRVDYDSLCLRLMGPLLMAADGTDCATLAGMTFDPSVIYVNQHGKRWINEQVSQRKGFFHGAIPLREQPGGISFTLFDADCVADAIRRAGESAAPTNPFGPPHFPEHWKEDMERAVRQYPFGVFQAESVEELAGKIGVDPAALAETVARYNAQCDQGLDPDFCKEQGLVPLRQAPFYAIRCGMATDGAFGGVPVDESCRAQSAQGGVMENLFVTGDFASGRLINQGGIKVQIINDLAWAFASGFMAGTRAAELLKETDAGKERAQCL